MTEDEKSSMGSFSPTFSTLVVNPVKSYMSNCHPSNCMWSCCTYIFQNYMAYRFLFQTICISFTYTVWR